MVSKKMQKAISKQINNELYSAYLYQAMAAQAAVLGFKGTAHWFDVQAREETGHARKFYDYLLEQGSAVEFMAIEKPAGDFSGPAAMFEAALKHEQFITRCINDLMKQAADEGDYASQILLQWYVTEQVEEEANATAILGQLKLAGASGGAQLMLDHQLGKREFKG